MSTNKRTTNDMLTNLYIKPVKDKGINAPRYPQFEVGYLQQADLLFLPSDDEYKYALVVVDAGSHLVDAQPIKNKSSEGIIKAFDKIYARKIVSLPKVISFDSGSEFKGSVQKYFEDKDIHIKTALPGRHRQQAIVERKNRDIGRLIFKRMTAEELLTGEPALAWADDLPRVIKEINSKVKVKKMPKFDPTDLDYKCSGDACDVLIQGTKVRAVLDMPRDVATGKRLSGPFRESDIRFAIKPRIVMKTLVAPQTVPMYALDDGKGGVDNSVLYTKNQLQVIPENEQLPDESLILGNKTKGKKKFIIDKILSKKKIKGLVHYEVKWKGVKDTTFEPRKTLLEDVPELVSAFEFTIRS